MKKLFILFAAFILVPAFCWASCDPEWENCYKIEGEWHLDCIDPCTDLCVQQPNGCITGEIPDPIYEPIEDTCRCWCECEEAAQAPEFSSMMVIIAAVLAIAVTFLLLRKK
ncbi:hypothetical protein KY312_00875 [Candidatus Woesearchaeota archaeon]|nr:hypothetical protein [Candidatus Woesearchaeota archaeon]